MEGPMADEFIEDIYEDENVLEGAWVVYHFWFDEQISDYNTDFCYQLRDYITKCYRKGVVS